MLTYLSHRFGVWVTIGRSDGRGTSRTSCSGSYRPRGTLISAILFLFRQKWRTVDHRSAEAMTLFAVMCAGIFPLFHTGVRARAYWLFPIPTPISACGRISDRR